MSNLQPRSEWKYICTDGQLKLIQSRLDGLLNSDPHSKTNGTYQVHSLYFDDYRDSCAADNEAGIGIRCKYRLRYYNNDINTLHLERKSKQYGSGDKKTCPVTLCEYHELLAGYIVKHDEGCHAGAKHDDRHAGELHLYEHACEREQYIYQK